jgi:16S rRNA (guanine966-N2)-methyltransferase
MQITGGEMRGRKLLSPEGGEIRPSASRTREALFNLLLHAPPPEGCASALIGQRVADICCGSGLLAFEALSRRAEHAVLVDVNHAALQLARENAERLGVESRCTLLRADAACLPPCAQPCAAVLADPPYRSGLARSVLEGALRGGWLAAGSYITLEMAAEEQPPECSDLRLYTDRIYGKARLVVWVRA